MQFADGGHLVPGVPDPVMPGRHAAVIGECVAPIASLKRIAPGRDGRVGRATERAGAIRVLGPRAAMLSIAGVFTMGWPAAPRNRRLWLTDQKTTRFAGWAISRTPLKLIFLAQDFALCLAFVLGAVKAAALELGDHQVDELVD
ncbi:MAG: hypothetical protein VXW49_15885, partial [Pseudomonadota bacterium]|nr:hypothetical protein [Pseudomonadota bacterium]